MITKKFYLELAEYTNRNPDLVEARCKSAVVELAWLWEQYKDNPTSFYKETDLYCFDLSEYCTTLKYKWGFHDWYKRIINQYEWKTMLDFGGGIGETTIIPAQMGVDTTYLDIKDSKTMEYAKWRFAKHGVNPTLLTENSKIERRYDFIVAMDVLEHLPNPDEVLRMLCAHTDYIFANPNNVNYNWIVPQHISKFDMLSYCDHVDRDLFKVRRREE